MTRKEYIEKLETIRVALLHLGADFKSARITDEQPMEEARRKVADKFFDKLDTYLYENGAVSLRIMDENAKGGIGEQGDLFDEARQESATNETEEPAEELDFPTEEKPFPDDIVEATETPAPTDITKLTATKTIGVCKYCSKGSGVGGCNICVLEPNYGKERDGLDTECENHAEKKSRNGKKGGK